MKPRFGKSLSTIAKRYCSKSSQVLEAVGNQSWQVFALFVRIPWLTYVHPVAGLQKSISRRSRSRRRSPRLNEPRVAQLLSVSGKDAAMLFPNFRTTEWVISGAMDCVKWTQSSFMGSGLWFQWHSWSKNNNQQTGVQWWYHIACTHKSLSFVVSSRSQLSFFMQSAVPCQGFRSHGWDAPECQTFAVG